MGRSARVLVIGLFVITSLLLQTTVMTRLAVLGVAPDLVLVVVACFAFTAGPGAGMGAGFAGGMLVDLTSDHTLGVMALLLTAVGYLAGTSRAVVDRLATAAPLFVVFVAGLITTLTFAALGSLLGDVRVSAAEVGRAALVAALYDAFLTPFVLAAVSATSRRSDPAERWAS